MTDHPIIFSAPMVRALLDGRKTVTRRLAWRSESDIRKMDFICDGERPNPLSRPAGAAGIQMAGKYWLRPTNWCSVNISDRLWVRESLQSFAREPRATAQYVADITGVPHRGVVDGWCDGRAYWQWDRKSLPSIHMPRWASRLVLSVTAVKIERLQEISEADAIAEGVYTGKDGDLGPLDISARALFADLWRKLHGPDSADANPEVVAITFTVHKCNIDAMPSAEVAA